MTWVSSEIRADAAAERGAGAQQRHDRAAPNVRKTTARMTSAARKPKISGGMPCGWTARKSNALPVNSYSVRSSASLAMRVVDAADVVRRVPVLLPRDRDQPDPLVRAEQRVVRGRCLRAARKPERLVSRGRSPHPTGR